LLIPAVVLIEGCALVLVPILAIAIATALAIVCPATGVPEWIRTHLGGVSAIHARLHGLVLGLLAVVVLLGGATRRLLVVFAFWNLLSGRLHGHIEYVSQWRQWRGFQFGYE